MLSVGLLGCGAEGGGVREGGGKVVYGDAVDLAEGGEVGGMRCVG